MTVALDDGFGGFWVLLLAGFLVHEPWRWLGLVVGARLSVDGEVFRWVRSVATALVAALVIRLVLFPAGALAEVSLAARLGAFVLALGVFMAAGRNLGIGVAAGALGLIAARLLGV